MFLEGKPRDWGYGIPKFERIRESPYKIEYALCRMLGNRTKPVRGALEHSSSMVMLYHDENKPAVLVVQKGEDETSDMIIDADFEDDGKIKKISLMEPRLYRLGFK